MRISVGIKLGLWLSLLVTLSIGLIGYYVYDRSEKLVMDSEKDKLVTSTRVLAHGLSDALAEIATDAKFVEALPLTRQILDADEKTGNQSGEKQRLAEVFSALLASRPEYAQIRLIDPIHYGKELVRVDRDQNGVKIIPDSQLQEKNHFAYVFETVRLGLGGLYISEINLNQELGAHLGFGKPTVRIAAPIGNQDRKVVGIVVINVNLDDLFNQLRANLPSGIKVLLANNNGDYLIHPDSRKTFAFERGQRFLIQDDIPATGAILSGDTEHIVTLTDNAGLSNTPSLAAFVRLPLGASGSEPAIVLGLYTSLEHMLANSRALERNVSKVTLLFSIIAAVLSLTLARILTQPLNAMAKMVSNFELGSKLDHLPSRRNDEIGYLAQSFVALTVKLNQQIAEVHASEAKLQSILDNLPLGIWLIGIEGQSRFLNKSFRDDLGISDQQFFSDPRFSQLLQIDDSFSPADAPIVEYAKLVFNDKREHLLEIHKVKLFDQFAASHALIGIAIDITERKQAEEVLRSSEEKLRSMFEMSPLGIAQNAMDGRYIEVNKSFMDMVGYTLDELNRMSYWQLTPNEYEPQEQEQLQSLAEIGKYGPYEKEYFHRDGHRFPIRLNGVLITDSDGEQYIWSIVEDITQRKQSEQLIWKQANFDPLTNLPNRLMFHDRLEQDIKKAHRTGLSLALIFLDLDRFKEINDTLGHDMGDLLLQDAAHRINSCVRESDTVARMGGDEFTLILGDLDDLTTVERIAFNILRKLTEPFQLKNKLAYVSASIGVTFYPKDGRSSEELIKNADQAMYAAKHQGRNRLSYFTPSMHDAALVRMQIASDLRGALAAGQFQLQFQPIVNLSNGQIYKAEALLRWLHPKQGFVSPNEFIPIAEDIGVINAVGNWVFYEATQQVAKWRLQHHPRFQISINKSPAQFFTSGNNHQNWLDHLEKLELPGSSVMVEITEGLLLEANDEVGNLLRIFRKAGIQISLDDFGTGYSALAYLKKFPIDYIKIDRSFVSHLSANSSDMALCEAIIVMAHKLGMKVVAEGIETEHQRLLLTAAGCDYGQGFLFSRPLSAEEFTGFLADYRSSF